MIDKSSLMIVVPRHYLSTLYDRLLERGKSSGRSDDNIEVIEKRLLTYEEQTRPVINKFAALGLVRTVDANRSIDEVYSDVSRFFA